MSEIVEPQVGRNHRVRRRGLCCLETCYDDIEVVPEEVPRGSEHKF